MVPLGQMWKKGVGLGYAIGMIDECITVIVPCSLSLCVFWIALRSCLVWNVLSASNREPLGVGGEEP